MSPIRVAIAEDHRMVRQGLAQALAEEAGVRVVGQADNGEQALALVARGGLDVLVVDYGLPDLDGAAVTTRVRREAPDVRVIILTVHDNIHYVIKSLDAGAHGFVVKSDAVEDLVRAIRTVHAGSDYLPPRLAAQLEEHRRGPKGRHVGLDKLSQREFELLRHMGGGKNLQECALQMGISESTASTYRARLMSKLELSHTAQIIRFALDNDIVPRGAP